MQKALLAKKAIDVIKDEKTRKQLLNVYVIALSAIILPAILFFGFIDSALDSFSVGEINEDLLSSFDEELTASELEQNRMDACTYVFFTFFSDYAEEDSTVPSDIISTVKENESGEEILRALSDIYAFDYSQNDIDSIDEILGGDICSPWQSSYS